jgi:DNA-binding PadR family transcriptional regulator
MRFSLNGYVIAKIANDIIGPWAKVSNGTLYPLLTKLEKAGLIELVNGKQDQAQSERQSRTFAITELGRKRFYQLMMETTSNLGDYQKQFHYKIAYLDLLPSRESLYLLNHYINYCQACILHIKAEAENLVHELADNPTAKPFHLEMTLHMMNHRIEQWQAEVDWTMKLREKLVALVENEKSRET